QAERLALMLHGASAQVELHWQPGGASTHDGRGTGGAGVAGASLALPNQSPGTHSPATATKSTDVA
ncbi:MAG: hypothetical protein HC876_07110, partial [Chloroflexaceae bacterium]|nr:hypothetical protein [Chloroflexaceae bacterium]